MRTFRGSPIRPSPRGQAVVLFALILVILIGMAGLAIDGGLFFVHRRQMQNAADAGALDGTRVLVKKAQAVCTVEPAARKAALDAALANGVAMATDVTVGLVDKYGNPQASCSNTTTKGVSVSVAQPYDTNFGRVLGINSISAGATGTATFGFINALIGALPIVLNRDSVPNVVNDGQPHPAALTPAAASGTGPVNVGNIDPAKYGQTLADALASGLRIIVTSNKGCGTPPKPCTAGSITSFDASVVAALQARIDSAPNETWNKHATGSRRVAVMLIINGDIGNPTVIPVGFATVFIDAITGNTKVGGKQNELDIHFISDTIAPAGARIDLSLDTAPDGTPTIMHLIR